MKKAKKIFMTGLKLLVLNFIVGILFMIESAIIGAIGFSLSIATIFTGGFSSAVLFAVITVLVMLVVNVFIGGFVANKLWKWD